MSVYIGKTKQTLTKRKWGHNSNSKIKSHTKLYQWYDDTCEIELIEICIINPRIREMEIVQEHIDRGYTVMNTQDGRHILDPIANKKKITNKHNANRTPEYIKNMNIKARTKNK